MRVEWGVAALPEHLKLVVWRDEGQEDWVEWKTAVRWLRLKTRALRPTCWTARASSLDPRREARLRMMVVGREEERCSLHLCSPSHVALGGAGKRSKRVGSASARGKLRLAHASWHR